MFFLLMSPDLECFRDTGIGGIATELSRLSQDLDRASGTGIREVDVLRARSGAMGAGVEGEGLSELESLDV